MSTAAFFSQLSKGEEPDLTRLIFEALVSDNNQELEKAVDRAKEADAFSDQFKHNLEGLYYFRDFYGNPIAGLSPEQLDEYKDYDEEWTMELIRELQRHHFETYEGETLELTPE